LRFRASTINSVADAERLARRRLPKVVFENIRSGAALTLRRNLEAFEEIEFRPRVAVANPSLDLSTTILGHEVGTPIMIAPTGSNRMFRREGEPGLARAAGHAGAIYVTSCLTGYPLDEVLAEASAPVFFNLYTVDGRATSEAMLEKAKAAGCRALVLTVDMMGAGEQRARAATRRTAAPVGRNLATAWAYAPQLAGKPGWVLDAIRDPAQFDCAMWTRPDGRRATYADVLSVFRAGGVCATWDDLSWIRSQWTGPIIMKGLLRTDDALRAVDAGVDGIVVSNHGARNVDGSPATLRVLPEIVDAVGQSIEVYFDGGIRRGTDVIKALAIGARAVLVGRAYLYAYAAAGEAGVKRIYELLHAEMRATLGSLGRASVRELDRSDIDLLARKCCAPARRE
jgi:isopentenyl diphosphate isomerase/L-lactate dehydrogenase-like FMN-dependent dehydrogenase